MRGHEFHYTGVTGGQEEVTAIYRLNRGTGCFDRRDGILHRNTLAAFTHIHALGNPDWADNFVKAAANYKQVDLLFPTDKPA